MMERDRIQGGNPAPAVTAQADPGAANATAILHEIRHALSALLERGQETVIDLRSLPFGPAALAELDEVLGDGEVEAAIEAFGSSRVRETGTAGVWLVEHLDAEGEVRARFVEITFLPAILRADPEDVRDGLRRLADRLADREESAISTRDERKPS